MMQALAQTFFMRHGGAAARILIVLRRIGAALLCLLAFACWCCSMGTSACAMDAPHWSARRAPPRADQLRRRSSWCATLSGCLVLAIERVRDLAHPL
jgi:hypothetical protein